MFLRLIPFTELYIIQFNIKKKNTKNKLEKTILLLLALHLDKMRQYSDFYCIAEIYKSQ